MHILSRDGLVEVRGLAIKFNNMKFIKILTHPILLIISFSMIIIIGQKFSGFYIMYVFMALFELHIHAVWAFIGAILLAVGHQRKENDKAKGMISITGSLLLVLSVFTFFYNDKDHYNWDTFNQARSLISLGIFGMFWIVFVIRNMTSIMKFNKQKILQLD